MIGKFHIKTHMRNLILQIAVAKYDFSNVVTVSGKTRITSAVCRQQAVGKLIANATLTASAYPSTILNALQLQPTRRRRDVCLYKVQIS